MCLASKRVKLSKGRWRMSLAAQSGNRSTEGGMVVVRSRGMMVMVE